MQDNLFVLLVITIIIAGACYKLIVDKKKGVKCSGCPYSVQGSKGCYCPEQAAPRDN